MDLTIRVEDLLCKTPISMSEHFWMTPSIMHIVSLLAFIISFTRILQILSPYQKSKQVQLQESEILNFSVLNFRLHRYSRVESLPLHKVSKMKSTT